MISWKMFSTMWPEIVLQFSYLPQLNNQTSDYADMCVFHIFAVKIFSKLRN